jgi:flagellar motility protein MotE (MotC chaperone)
VRQTWTYFVVGVAIVLSLAVFLPKTQAQSEDPRVKQLKNPEISGLKTEVPPAAELDSAIKKKEKELTEKEARVKEAEERLAAEEARLKIRISELEKLQNDIESLQNKSKEADQSVIAKIVKTFESMSPKKAAGVLATMNDDLAVEVLLKMKEKKLASVLDVMDATRATSLSSLMAGKRTAARVEALEKGGTNRSTASAGSASKKTSP